MRHKGLVTNKSIEIRKAARELTLKGELPRPKTIVGILKDKGITVSGAQVSMALKGTPYAYRKNDPGAHFPFPTPLEALSQTRAREFPKAEEFAREMGSIDRAVAALIALWHCKREEPQGDEQHYGGA